MAKVRACAAINVSRMSPKLLRTQPHIVENRGITMAPLFLSLPSFIQIKNFCHCENQNNTSFLLDSQHSQLSVNQNKQNGQTFGQVDKDF